MAFGQPKRGCPCVSPDVMSSGVGVAKVCASCATSFLSSRRRRSYRGNSCRSRRSRGPRRPARREYLVVFRRLGNAAVPNATTLERFRCTVSLTMAAPIACQLNVFSAEERWRYQAVRKQIEAAVIRMVEVENGYLFHLPDDDATLVLVVDWVALERRCCPFFEFNISVGGSEPSIRVAMTGSTEVKQFLKLELGAPVVSPNRPLHQRT